jgi:hypothetical protein
MRMPEWLEDEQIRGTLLLLSVVGLVVFLFLVYLFAFYGWS